MKKLSLKIKLYILVLSLLAVMVVGMMVTVQSSLRQMEDRLVGETSALVQDVVMDRLGATAGEFGEQMSGQFNAAFKVPEVLASIVEENVRAIDDERTSRSALMDAIRAVFDSQKGFDGIYAYFEPDAYDGQDRYFTGGVEEHSSDTGAFHIYYYYDSDGDLQFERIGDASIKYNTTLNEFGAREAEYYLCPKESKAACVLEPYIYVNADGSSQLLTTLVTPVLNNNAFSGVVGVDINLNSLQKTVMGVSLELYDGQ